MKCLPLYTLAGIAPIILAFWGCSSAGSMPPASQSPTSSAAEHTDHANRDHLAGSLPPDTEKMKASLAKLSSQDATSAEKQHICPVSGNMLGTMGLPGKVAVNGQQIWICCDGCKDQLQKNPDQYLAKLKKE